MKEMCGEMEGLRAAAGDQQPMGLPWQIWAVRVGAGGTEEETDCPP